MGACTVKASGAATSTSAAYLKVVGQEAGNFSFMEDLYSGNDDVVLWRHISGRRSSHAAVARVFVNLAVLVDYRRRAR